MAPGLTSKVAVGAASILLLAIAARDPLLARMKTFRVENLVLQSSTKLSACQPHHYSTHLFSRDPLVIYISSFVSADEAFYLSNME
jgi:hypothetical protein